jgi:hypothetical protein
MSRLSEAINTYFIDMVEDEEAKVALKTRSQLSQEERLETPLPNTKTILDAFYVVMGCRFQDSPVFTFIITISFVVIVGLMLANLVSLIAASLGN